MKRATAILLTAVAFFIFVPRAEALWNDSNSIQLPDAADTNADTGTPPDPGAGGTSGNAGAGQDGGASGAGGGNQGGAQGVDQSNPGVSGDIIGGSNPGDLNLGHGNGGAAAEQLLQSLSGNGGLHTSTPTDGANSGGTPGGLGQASQRGTISISGGSVRSALAGSGASRAALRTLNAAFSSSVIHLRAGTSVTDADVGLVAASTAIKDANIMSAAIAAGQFDLVYRFNAYLFAFVPISFPARIRANPDAADAVGRVTVRYPWYSFVVRKPASKASLTQLIDAALIGASALAPEGEDSRTREARILVAITNALAARYGAE